MGVVGVEHIVVGVGKTTIFVDRLHAEFDAVEKKHHLVGIVQASNELGGLEGGHRLARPRGVPNETAAMSMLVPVGFLHALTDFGGGEILVAAQDLERPVFVVGNGVIAHHVVGEGDGEKGAADGLPIEKPPRC